MNLNSTKEILMKLKIYARTAVYVKFYFTAKRQ